MIAVKYSTPIPITTSLRLAFASTGSPSSTKNPSTERPSTPTGSAPGNSSPDSNGLTGAVLGWLRGSMKPTPASSHASDQPTTSRADAVLLVTGDLTLAAIVLFDLAVILGVIHR